MLNASEARKIAETIETGAVQTALKQIETKIKAAAGNGSVAISVEHNLNPLVVKQLKEAGYKVDVYHGDYRDPGYTNISW